MKTKRRNQRGFTLLEIMVVVAILGLLAAMIVPNVIGQGEQAKVDIAKTNMSRIVQQLDMYKFNNGRYPSTEEGIRALVERPASAKKWPEGGYLPQIPQDPWGNDYVYLSPGVDGPFDLYSLGADGAEGGTGVDADISWRDSSN
ncbi:MULTISPECIES: type II secretion system major pseudopilin GspG [Alloalcanivorax]|jgi:general secretion pathway protein G|uniref:Type II secretion system core protein G n=3 Tax=Alloalcanivorax TaxID=3020832 RepID=K0CFI7_ALCDB|nr:MULTISPECIES: type II secretion system major pseudopilin GspG [Alloalcanivorax]ERS13099.1 secretion system protein G [Alcanivorax sp. PN-3]KYZ88021.1 type II secretion system protein GspG [Alcanivorax sp. KX64203]MBA4720242.1 type II secretion system major pseudopilin GspG [Alcanivorax sp.]AFT70487.1 General secretion pathway protein GspG [Alloalcanivorax dieselolei B5]ARB45808.1 general secretion pathway protein GspG [Alloalcanivorax xenomutans]|tara:strand:- start:519 stop:950 length:432 start_codon:yes stop_codon:yes gene_type:complete